MKKYIIENCPNCWSNNHNECIKSIRQGAFANASETELYKYCKDITDCPLKQIVFFCKMDVGSRDNMLLISRYALADLILDVLKIKEM